MSEKADLFGGKSVRSALRLWDDLPKLGNHPLARLRIVERRRISRNQPDTPEVRGLCLREILGKAIRETAPDSGCPNYSDKRWHCYIILQERFINGRDPDYLASQLGIARRTYEYTQSKAFSKLASILWEWEKESHDAPIPETRPLPFSVPPKPPHRLVGRYNLLEDLKAQLFAGGNIALCGLPGVGKTALAMEVAYDDEVLAYFRDGVLWIGLGRNPDVLSLLGRLALDLGVSPNDVARQNTVTDLANVVHRAIGTRSILLVVDDAWQIEAAQAFCVGGPNCARLLTTRFPGIARDFAEGRSITVRELSSTAGTILFEQLAPELAEAYPDTVQEIVQRVGGLPLSIILMAKYVRQEAPKGMHALHSAIGQLLRSAEGRLRLMQPQMPAGVHPSLPKGAPLSLLAVIEISAQVLDEASRRTLRALSVFPPKPNTFSREAAVAVSAEPAEALDTLIDRGLLESSGQGRYTLHQATSDYAGLAGDNDMYKRRMASFFVNWISDHEEYFASLEVESGNILTALEIGFDIGMEKEFVQGVNKFYSFLEARGLYVLAESLLLRAEGVARRIHDPIILATTLLHLGKLAFRQGRYEKAELYLQEGLAQADKLRDQATTIDLLSVMGRIAQNRGEIAQAEKYYRECLEMARKMGDRRRIGHLYARLGTVAACRGAREEAESYYRESLAQGEGSPEEAMELFRYLGWLAWRHGDYGQAEACFRQGFAIAHAVGHRLGISALLYALGAIAEKRGDYDQAAEHYQAALGLAQEIGCREYVAYALEGLGTAAFYQQDYGRAEDCYNDALKQAKEMKDRPQICSLLRNLGRVATAQGRYEQAMRYLEEGLLIAHEIGDPFWIGTTLAVQSALYLKMRSWDRAEDALRRALQIARDFNIRIEELVDQGALPRAYATAVKT